MSEAPRLNTGEKGEATNYQITMSGGGQKHNHEPSHISDKNTSLTQDRETLILLAQGLGKSLAWLTGHGTYEDDMSRWRGIKISDKR